VKARSPILGDRRRSVFDQFVLGSAPSPFTSPARRFSYASAREVRLPLSRTHVNRGSGSIRGQEACATGCRADCECPCSVCPSVVVAAGIVIVEINGGVSRSRVVSVLSVAPVADAPVRLGGILCVSVFSLVKIWKPLSPFCPATFWVRLLALSETKNP
jgi:hypothetical protein